MVSEPGQRRSLPLLQHRPLGRRKPPQTGEVLATGAGFQEFFLEPLVIGTAKPGIQ
ncbi:MAG: hypothetical protein LAN71_07850 [Acidobacteriia bacterium]|nr:hypothetical protein [Terriglobia bacterium]